MKVEIRTSADGLDLIANHGNEYRKINENDALVDLIADLIKQKYPKVDRRLNTLYNTKFKRVRRFCKCNFAIQDNVPDLDNKQFNFEFVNCPLRGECMDENIICNPTLKTGLTIRETQVVREFASGKMAKEVAVSLRISQNTAEIHKKHVYAKLGIATIGELVNFARDNGIYIC